MPLASLLVSLAPALGQAQALDAAELEAWRADLAFLCRELDRRHKNLYHTITREDFAARVAALEQRLPSLARHEIIVAFAQLVGAVGDGHTNLYPTRDPRVGFHELPVSFALFEGELFVRAAHESQRALVGGRVVRIGELDPAEALARVATMIGRDNEQGVWYWGPYLLGMPEVLHALRITATLGEVPLVVSTASGELRAGLRALADVPIMRGERATLFDRRPGWADARDGASRPEPAWLRETAPVFWFEHQGDLLYVQLCGVTDGPTETLAAFSQRLKEEIARTAPAKVALDLRLNRGGDGTLLPPLIRALVQSESIDRPGRLFAIIGPATFSAAQMLANALEKYTRVTFVGEPTGSKGNHYGDSRRFELPHSGLTVRASVYYWQEWHPLDERQATMPQLPAPLSFEAYRDNVDPALAAIEAFVPPDSER